MDVNSPNLLELFKTLGGMTTVRVVVNFLETRFSLIYSLMHISGDDQDLPREVLPLFTWRCAGIASEKPTKNLLEQIQICCFVPPLITPPCDHFSLLSPMWPFGGSTYAKLFI